MPNWVAAYFALYGAFVLWAHSEDFQVHRGLTIVGLTELGGNLALLLVALSLWLPTLRGLSPSLLRPLYVAGCALFVAHGVRAGRKATRGLDLSTRGKLLVAASGSAFGVSVTAPLIYWGWQAIG